MLKLKHTKHSYYCEAQEYDCRTTEYESWNEFKEKEIPYDFDYNLLFRFDIFYHDDSEIEDERFGTYSLFLHHALQRHGQEQWHAIIHNINDNDLPEIEVHLANAKNHLMKMWKEISISSKK